MNRLLEQGALALVVLAGLSTAPAAEAAPNGPGFHSPYAASPGLRQPAKRMNDCPAPPPPVRDLAIESIFVRGQWNDKVPERVAARQAVTKPLHDYLAHLAGMANATMQLAEADRGPGRACFMSWISAWAQGGALRGNVPWPEGQYEVKWTVIALSEMYLQLYAGATEAPPLPAAVADWLRALSAPFPQQYPDSAEHKQNHFYWAGLAGMVVGTVLRDNRFYAWGKHRIEQGLSAIDADGYLPLELERGKLALWYHAFAASPLVQAAAFDAANGGRMLASNGEAIRRLARRVFAGLQDPAMFQQTTGVAQSAFSRGDQNSMGWIELYYRLTRDAAAEPWLRTLRPFNIIWLGGNISAAFGVPLGPGPKGASPLFATPAKP